MTDDYMREYTRDLQEKVTAAATAAGGLGFWVDQQVQATPSQRVRHIRELVDELRQALDLPDRPLDTAFDGTAGERR